MSGGNASAGAPDVSIVMPVRRPRADWFAEAVASVLAGEAVTLELIVVDDGSDPPIALPVDDPRVRVVRTDPVGTYAARDVGLSHARGRHVRFFDGDDVSVAGSTTRLYRLLDGATDVVAYGLTTMCDEQLAPYREVVERIEGDATEACLLGGYDAYHVSMLFPAEVIRAAGAWEAGFDVSGDWDFVLRTLEHSRVVRLDEVVTLYRRSPGSITGRARKDQGMRARRRVIERFATRHPDERALVRRAQAAADRTYAEWYAADGERAKAWYWRLRAASRRLPAAHR